MANTTRYYQSVDLFHWQPATGPLSLAPPPVVPLLLQQEDQPSVLQACALLALVWIITTFIPKPQGRQQHFKTAVLKWLSGTYLLLCMLGFILSLGSNGINVDSIINNLPMLSGSLVWQALQLIRLTMMAWFIKELYGTPNKPSYTQQEIRKTYFSTQSNSPTESEFVLDFISKSLDKFIIFAVLFASVILFFCSVLYLAVKPMLGWIHKSGCYKNALNLGKQLTSQFTMSLGKHPFNRKMMVLVPTSLVISACVSSAQVLEYV